MLELKSLSGKEYIVTSDDYCLILQEKYYYQDEARKGKYYLVSVGFYPDLASLLKKFCIIEIKDNLNNIEKVLEQINKHYQDLKEFESQKFKSTFKVILNELTPIQGHLDTQDKFLLGKREAIKEFTKEIEKLKKKYL